MPGPVHPVRFNVSIKVDNALALKATLADRNGTPVAGIGGYKDAAAYNKFIMDAKKQAKTAAAN